LCITIIIINVEIDPTRVRSTDACLSTSKRKDDLKMAKAAKKAVKKAPAKKAAKKKK
jgi:hypothetical protein